MPEVAAIVNQLAFIDGIGFDPFFRGLLSVLVAVVVLIGGTYLLIATNTGARQGLLVSAASLFGWMFLMGIIWTIYGIGWAGQAPSWELREINVDDSADTDDGLLFSEVDGAIDLTRGAGSDGLPQQGLGELVGDVADPDAAQAEADAASKSLDLGPWRYLQSSDGIRGEAQASADAFLVNNEIFEVGGYLADQYGAFIRDGKPVLVLDDNDGYFTNQWKRVAHTVNETILHPRFAPEVIVIQVRGTTDQPTLPGKPPPVATVDPSAPLVSVIMERDRGGPFPSFFSGLRFTPAMFTVFNGLIFAAFAWNMHTRDERESKIRSAAA